MDAIVDAYGPEERATGWYYYLDDRIIFPFDAICIKPIGMVNFLFDSSGKPHVKSRELYEWFGISESTGNGKSRQIRDLLKIGLFDKKWTLPSRMKDNPRAWMIQLNGFLLDARYCKPEIQLEAYKKGLIPYLPGVNALED